MIYLLLKIRNALQEIQSGAYRILSTDSGITRVKPESTISFILESNKNHNSRKMNKQHRNTYRSREEEEEAADDESATFGWAPLTNLEECGSQKTGTPNLAGHKKVGPQNEIL